MSFSFLLLPVELRRIVYREYLSSDGGYLYNPDSGRLTCADRQPIDLSLRYTCLCIADETRHLALRYNTLTFYPGGPSMVLQRKLPPQDLWMSRSYPWKDAKSWNPGPPIAYGTRFRYEFPLGSLFEYRKFISSDVADQANSKFPALKPFLDYILEDRISHEIRPFYPWYIERNGEAPSLMIRWRDFIMQTAARCYPLVAELAPYRDCFDYYDNALLQVPQEMIHQHDEYPHAESGPVWLLPTICSASYRRHPPPVRLPDRHPVTPSAVIFESYNVDQIWENSDQQDTPPTYSATALAISYMGSLERLDCLSIRHILLRETEQSFAAPARHAQGLIPFCRENANLVIDRVVDVIAILRDLRKHMYRSFTRVESVSAILGLWLAEADELGGSGMPMNSFRFIFDGGKQPEIASHIFQTVMQRDWAWQVAFDQLFASSITYATFWSRRRHNCCIYNDFPRLMKRLCDPNDTALTANFDLGTPWSEDQLPRNRNLWSLRDWNTHWRHRPEYKLKRTDLDLPRPSRSTMQLESPGLDDRVGYMNDFAVWQGLFEPTMPRQ